MTTVGQEDIGRAIDDVFGTETPRTVTVHQSGAVSIVIHAAQRVVVIDGTAAHTEWGVSVDPEDEEAYTGHAATFTSLAEALRTAHASIRS